MAQARIHTNLLGQAVVMNQPAPAFAKAGAYDPPAFPRRSWGQRCTIRNVFLADNRVLYTVALPDGTLFDTTHEYFRLDPTGEGTGG